MMATMKIKIKKRPGKRTGLGTGWTEGTVGPYRFQALVFPEHADNEDWELGRSRISKLWVGHGNSTIFEWDRGLSHPAEMVVEHQAVNLLKDNLARMVFGAAVVKAGGKRRSAKGKKSSLPGAGTTREFKGPPGWKIVWVIQIGIGGRERNWYAIRKSDGWNSAPKKSKAAALSMAKRMIGVGKRRAAAAKKPSGSSSLGTVIADINRLVK
jgi:hypothetical protein